MLASTMTDTFNAKNNAELRQIITRLQLTRKEVKEITGASVSLVDSWLLPPDSRNFKPMRSKALRLLRLELGLDKPAYTKLRLRGEQKLKDLVADVKGAA